MFVVFVSLGLSMCVNVCVCARTTQLPRPEAVSVGVFLEPRCHLPPNSNNVTNRREDGTNLITPYSPGLSLSGDHFNLSSLYVLDSRPPQVDSDSNYEYRVPLKWS